MLLLRRPPYLRWAAATFVIVAALAIEFRPSDTERIPIAIEAMDPGTLVTPDVVEWREVPTGIFTPVELPATAARMVPAGAPVVAADLLIDTTSIPADWWKIALEVPPGTHAGSTVIAVVPASIAPDPLVGMATTEPSEGEFGVAESLVAFPKAEAVAVAHGKAEGSISLLLGS